LLLSAQSNAAIDHLMDELAILAGDQDDGPLVVRCRARESNEEVGQFDIGVQAQRILKRLTHSALATHVSQEFKHFLAQLIDTTGSEATRASDRPFVPRSGHSRLYAIRAFEGVVMRAANVVFATTNSGDLERLIEERAQFDWAVVEEAGKATGSELISPLLLSHRRLMIGDHYQLPPFGSEQILKLLENHEAVRSALLVGNEFIGRSLRDETTEEMLDEIDEEENDLPAMCADAMRVLTLFEAMIETEFKRQALGRLGRPIAKKLTKQHRMQPTIAMLVSSCFYRGDLDTHPDCIEKYRTERPPFITVDPIRLPISPIVLVDMPYVQDTIGQRRGDSLPRWNNTDEVAAVVEVLRQLRADVKAKERPSLAVLSPYAQQVRRLAQAIAEQRLVDLAHLGAFDSPLKAANFCGTVDSFQGSEADLVMVSLVRNNHHATVRGALGFLSDFRRMNVLLSRARWQLVIVGSRNFLAAVVEAARGTEDEKDVEFLKTMVDFLDEGERQGTVKIVRLKGLGVAA
jgi:hypothetical protein